MAISTAVRSNEQRGAVWTVLLCFFASGMSGLVYQVIWARELVLIFGATTFAVSTVLTAFMGGLALGSFTFGRRSEKIARPLRLYGLLEIGIGLYGLAVPLIFAALPRIYQPFWQELHLSFFALSIVRFLFAALVLIIPTALMGATLPVLSSYYARDLSRIGLRVGSLYSLNTFGAVVGTAATGFVFVPVLGMQATTATAAGINILLGIVTLILSRKYETGRRSSEAAKQRSRGAGEQGGRERHGDAGTVDSTTSRGRGKGVSATDHRPSTTDHRPALLRRPAWPFALFGPRRARRERDQTRKKGRSKLASEPRLRAQDAETFGRAQLVTVLVGFALSGFVALSYEVIWSRVLALIIGSSVYAFSIMLMTFLIGLALGATFASRIVDRIRRPVFTFALIEIGVGITSLIGAYLFNELPYIFVQIYGWLEGSAFAVLLLARFLVASFVMIVPTLMLGAIFPLVVRIISASRGALAPGRTVGDAYAANTVGAIAGSFASGFVLIPWLGLLGSLKVSAALNFVVAGALFLASRRSMDRRAVSKHVVDARVQKDAAPPRRLSMPFGLRGSALAGCCVAAALVLVVVVFDPPWDSDVMSSAVYRYAPSLSKMSRQEFSEYLRNGQGETLFYREGITSTIAVQRQSGHLVLKANGKPEASTAGDMPTQVLIGALPLLARRQSDDVLLIGLGSGVTLGTIEQFPVKRVTCVELEPAMIEASRFFDDVNNRPLDDPRLRMVANDGRNYIYTTAERFDVIISEPSNPWVTGVANLFTLEYFKRGADRLKEGGLFSQWLQIYEMPPEDVKVLTATFHAAFPYVHIFRGAEGDLMLLGSRSPIELNREVIESHFADKRIASELGRVNTNSAGDLLSRFYLGTSEVARFSAGAPINTDDNALIEFSAPRHVGTAEETVELNVQQLLSAAGSPLPYMGEETMISGTQADFLLEAALGAVKRKDESRAEQFARYSLDIFETARTHGVLGELRFARKDEQAALDHWHRALELEPDHFYTLINMGKLYLGREDAPRAAPYLDRAIKAAPKSARARHLRGLAYQVAGDHLNAVLEYRKALPDAKYARSTENFYLNFGTALVHSGLYEEAAQMFEEYVKLAPKDYEGRYQLGAVYEILAERTLDDRMTYKAIDELKRALTLKPDHAMSHYYLSKAYRRLGRFDEAEAEFQMYENLTP